MSCQEKKTGQKEREFSLEEKREQMGAREFILERFGVFAGVSVEHFEGGAFSGEEGEDFSPVRTDDELREQLITETGRQRMPVIRVDEEQVVFVCIRDSVESFFFLGPVALTPMDRVRLHRFYRSHGVSGTQDRPIPVFSTAKLLLMVQVAAGILAGQEVQNRELIAENHLGKTFSQTLEQRKLEISMQEELQESDHHTYQEERRLLDAVSRGETQEALRRNIYLDGEIGKLSSSWDEQTERTAIIGITLCTRAAIEGGLLPTQAYQISDFYLQKLDLCSNNAQIIECRNQAVRTLTDAVREKQTKKKVSGYVEQCCDYIGKHYREKIYLNDLAEKMGITPTYLSRLFSQEMGVPLQEYIVQVRIERAKNLLAYSEAPISEIGDYVNFPSQSYFGRVFRKYTGLTPRQYRTSHKPREFDQ